MRFLLAGLVLASASASAQQAAPAFDPGAVPWATLRGHFDRFSANIGDVPATAWPGGGDYGAVSAVTGAVRIPEAANANMMGRTPGIIIAAGVQGLAVTDSKTAPGVGGYFGAGLGTANGNVWGINPTAKNFASSTGAGSLAFNGQVVGSEVDVALHTPAGGWGGSNAVGQSIQGDFQSQPDGELNAIGIGAVGAAPWKNALKISTGAANYAREVDPATPGTGASDGIFDMFVIRDAAGRPVQIIQGYGHDGKLVVRPLVAGAGVGLRLQDVAGHDRITLDAGSGVVHAPALVGDTVVSAGLLGTAGHIVSTGPAPSARDCGAGAVAAGSTDVRGRVTLPPGVGRCTIVLALPAASAPYVVVSSNVPGVATAVASGTGDGGPASFTIAMPPGMTAPVVVTWMAMQ